MMVLLISINRICSNKQGFLQAFYIKLHILYDKIEFLKNIGTLEEFWAGNGLNPENLDFRACLVHLKHLWVENTQYFSKNQCKI